MKKSLFSAFALSLALVCQSKANLYNFSFTGTGGIAGGPVTGPSVATGQVDVDAGFATSGYLDVTVGAGAGHYDLIIASEVPAVPRVSSFGNPLYRSLGWLSDDAVHPDADPFISDGGLLFGSGLNEFNLFFTEGAYYLGGTGGSTGHTIILFAEGTATLTAVPESGATLAMLGAALLGFAALRRRSVG